MMNCHKLLKPAPLTLIVLLICGIIVFKQYYKNRKTCQEKTAQVSAPVIEVPSDVVALKAEQVAHDYARHEASELGNYAIQKGEAARDLLHDKVAEAREKGHKAAEYLEEKGSQARNYAHDKGKEAKEYLAEKGSQARDYTQDKAKEVQHYAQEKGGKLREFAHDKASEAQEKGHKATEYLAEKGRETGNTLKNAAKTSANFVTRKVVAAADKTRQYIHDKTAPHKMPLSDEA